MKSIKLLYIITFAVGLLASCTYTASNLTRGGFYISGIDYLYCASDKICLHEQAHRLDAQRGFISSNPEYQMAIMTYAVDNPGKLWSKELLNYRDSWSELYAQLYESAGGVIDRMPVELQRFYR